MDYDDNSINSARTMGPDGVAPRRSVVEPSIGSAITTGGRTTPQGGRLRPGDVLLGRYTVLAPLGEGGMGVVYKCLDTIGRIEVALKCLPSELSRNESEMEGIRENYAIVARLHHSAISGLRQLEKDPDFGEYYLVMDLAKGEDLSTILRRRHGVPMPLDEALAILRPLALALDYAHGEHVLHRDVKPANVKVETLPADASQPSQVQSSEFKVQSSGGPTLVTRHPSLVTPNLRVQLLDFGLAAEVRSSMSRVSLRGHVGSSGTPDYMAPEQWEARRQSAATDQYSLAVMAYQMLSGYLPFAADDMEVLKSAVLTRPPDEIEDVPAHVNAALQKALAKNPKERFASCVALVEALEHPDIPGGSRSRATAAGGPPAPRQDGANSQGAPQRENHTEVQEHGDSVSGAAKPESRNPNIDASSTAPRRFWPWLLAGAAAMALGVGVWMTGGTSETGGTGGASGASEMTAPQGPHFPQVKQVPSVTNVPSVPSFSSGAKNALALPPKDASLEDLEAARVRFSDALEARRAEGWPDDSAESVPFVSALSTLDGRIAAELKAREEREKRAERERVAKRTADARAVAEMGRLKTAAVREAQGVDKFRKWSDGEFRTQFAILDRQKALLDGLAEAADLGKAKEAAADIHSAAVWIADNAEAREELDAIEKAIDALSPELEKTEANRYAQSAIYSANTARAEAVRRRDRSDFTGAKEKFNEAKRHTEAALAAARQTQASAKASEAVGEAEAARIREDWKTVVSKAAAALALDASNAAAKSLRDEAEAKLAAIKAEQERLAREEAERKAREEAARREAARKADEERLAQTGGGTKAGNRRVVHVGSQEVALRWCPPGSFTMGAPITEEGRGDNETQHRVTLTKGFWMGETEVTQGLWKEVMGDNPSSNKSGDNYPVVQVSWNDCQEFLKKLNARFPQSGLKWALPTEAQWEYACRAGTTGAYAGTGRLDDMGWYYSSNSGNATHPVKGKQPNAWGLYDMHGNVCEWCQDWYGDYPSGAVTDPPGKASGDYRVLRGGCSWRYPGGCRSASRLRGDPGNRLRYYGFRFLAFQDGK